MRVIRGDWDGLTVSEASGSERVRDMVELGQLWRASNSGEREGGHGACRNGWRSEYEWGEQRLPLTVRRSLQRVNVAEVVRRPGRDIRVRRSSLRGMESCSSACLVLQLLRLCTLT